MKYHLLLFVLIYSFCYANAQDESTNRLKIIDFHVGPSFSNFINTEAPHKSFLMLSEDEYILTSDPESTFQNYDASITKDIRYSISLGLGFEYSLKKNWSVYASFNYEGKGINLDDSNSQYEEHHYESESQEYTIQEMTSEKTKVKLSNNYLTMPVLMRKYFTDKQTFYLQGGMYLAYLLKSEGNISLQKAEQTSFLQYNGFGSFNDENTTSYFSSFDVTIDDKDKVHTAKFDFGLSFGTGLRLPLNDQLYFKADLLFNFGLKSIDSLNNNEYAEKDFPSSSGYSTAFQSKNYYGLNSKAKNINSVLTVGVGIKL